MSLFWKLKLITTDRMCVLLIVDDVYFLLIPNSSDQQCRKCSKVQQPGQKQRLPFHCVWNWSEFRFPKYILLRKIKKNLWKHLVSKYSQYFRIKWNDLSAEIMLGRFRSALYSAIGKFFIMFWQNLIIFSEIFRWFLT